MAAEIGELAVDRFHLCARGVVVAAQFGFAEERHAERALGQERAVSADACDRVGGVVAIEAQRGQALAAIGVVDGLVLDRLVLEFLVVLAVFVGDGANFFGSLLGQIVIRRGIGEDDLLTRRDADFALEQDEVFFERSLGVDARLLLGLKLDAGAELVEIGGGSGYVGFVGVVEQDLILGFESPGV